jgi:hypothetical protein
MMPYFINPRDPENISIKGKITEWIKALVKPVDGSEVLISEVNCVDPGCPDMETLITIKIPDDTKKVYRIRKPLVYVRKWDIEALMQ